MTPTLTAEHLRDTLTKLRAAQTAFAARYPGDRSGRQPVHVVYGGAHLFRADTAAKLGALALRSLDEHAPDATTFARALGLPDDDADRHARVYQRVRAKLTAEPVEDLRVDFEDGYGPRSDDEEDGHCLAVAHALARGMADETLPPFVGIRVKSLAPETTARALRTLDLVLTSLVAAAGNVPARFVVTLPKVVMPEQVTALVEAIALLERALGLRDGAVSIELMVEATQSMLSPRGEVTLAALLDAARGRCAAAHFGAYDYTAGCNVASGDQHLGHPWCEHARHLMQLAFAGTGVRLSDGATTTLPVGPHRAKEGVAPTEAAREANRAVVHRAWRLHADNIARALAEGYGQGWDLHPAQLPARYGAVYDYYLRGAATAGERLRAFVARAAQATRAGAAFDDAATAQAMVNFFLRAVDAGALSDDEAAGCAGVPVALLRTRSFAAIAGAP